MKRQQGQGLIETMITVVVIGISVTALMRLQNNLAYSDLLVRQQSEAIRIAESELEKARGFEYKSIHSPNYPLTEARPTYDGILTKPPREEPRQTTTYTVTLTVIPAVELPYKNVDVKVAWTDVYNQPQSVELSTIIGKAEPFCKICVLSNACTEQDLRAIWNYCKYDSKN